MFLLRKIDGSNANAWFTFCLLLFVFVYWNQMIVHKLHLMRMLHVIFKWEILNLVPRAHVSFGQRQDAELWNNPFPDSKILGLPVSRRMRALA